MQKHTTQSVLLILNPASGKRRGSRQVKRWLQAILSFLEENGCRVDTYMTEKPGDAAVFAEQLASKYDLVVCGGGDGTLHEVINGLMRAAVHIPLGYLPAGTTNDMARVLQLPNQPLKAAQVLVKGHMDEQDIGVFNDTRYFSYVASFGALTSVPYSTPQWIKNRVGYLAYLFQVLRSLSELRPYALEMKIDGQTHAKGRFIFGSISNAYSISGIFRFKPEDVYLNDGKFELMLLRYPENLRDFCKIASNLICRKADGHFVIFQHAQQVDFKFEEETAWTVDGEDGGASRSVRIRNLPKALTVIHNRADD